MKRLVLIIVICALAAPLVLATSAQARLWDPGAPSVDQTARAQLMAYVAQVAPVYAELDACACCCDTIDLPSHRCAACAAAAARLEKVAAKARHTQARLATAVPPDELTVAHAQLVGALSAIRYSAEYMASTVRTAPQELLTAAFVAPPRGRGGVAVVMRPSPRIVAAAEFAALPAPIRSIAWHHHLSRETDQTPSVVGTPGEHALAHLEAWRTAVLAQARALDVNLTHTLAS